MTRLWRSGASLDPDLRSEPWAPVHEAWRAGPTAADCDPGPEHLPLIGSDTYRHACDYLTRPQLLDHHCHDGTVNGYSVPRLGRAMALNP